MALQSQLFRGDQKLEAAAVSNPAHIVPGAAGEHVRKLQLALIRLEGATIASDGNYGPATADAVLAYKQKRKIINRSYQTTADNIVGTMTMGSLDTELCKLDGSQEPIELRVISPAPLHLNHRPHVLGRLGDGSTSAVSLTSAVYGPPNFSPGPIVTINKGQTALVEVKNGEGATIKSHDPQIASVRDPANRAAPLTHITTDPQTIEIVGNHRGGALIVANKASAPSLSLPERQFMASLTVSVKEVRRTVYTPTMTPHNHRPTRRWADLLKVIRQPQETPSGWTLWGLCKAGADPLTFVNLAKWDFTNKPVALRHLNWYLADGRGQELNEDYNIVNWVRSDAGIRQKVNKIILVNAVGRPNWQGWFLFDHVEFLNEDYLYSFGTIDRIDIQVDWVLKTVKLWFKDIYEWHPVCPGFYTQFPDDVVRVTNSLHAALVELKDSGAADYWMVGEATFPLSVFGFPP